MSTAQQRELVSSASVVGLTLDQYVRMIEQGILPEGEPIELLDGFLVRKDRSKAGEDPMTVGVEHMWAVKNLDRVLAEAKRLGCHVALQQPIALPPDGAPEPDGAVVRGSMDDYRARYPSAPDVPCVIEVADSSVHHDRVTKKRVYAKGGIAQYVIINLVDRQVEVFEEPAAAEERYARETVIKPGDTVRFSTGAGRAIEVEVTRLLP
jgi:Uma2 family endonuclease